MSSQGTFARVRIADEADLSELYDLATGAMALDRFSQDLLAEKLFRNPQPDQDSYVVYVAEVDGQVVGMMQSVHRSAEAKAWLGLFNVADGFRRRGIASRMFDVVKSGWVQAGVRDAEALAIPGNYLLPGLDPRYTQALCFLERHGFERFKDCANMSADLNEPFETAGEVKRLEKIGITVRRADDRDGVPLDAFFSEHFGEGWRLESQLAMRNDPPALHLALRDGKIIAFSAHSGQNREWGFFGPMGTTPETRGTGIGRVLLWRCLNDLRDAGHRTAVIPWVGPIGFYSRYCPCRVERVFWRYRTAVSEPSIPAT